MGQRPEPLSWTDLGIFAVTGALGNLGPMMMTGWALGTPVTPLNYFTGLVALATSCVGLAWIVAGLEGFDEPVGEQGEGEPNEAGRQDHRAERRSEEREERRPALAGHGEP